MPRHGQGLRITWMVATSKARTDYTFGSYYARGFGKLLVDFSQPLRSPLCIWGFLGPRMPAYPFAGGQVII
jgi:hypothetical protein